MSASSSCSYNHMLACHVSHHNDIRSVRPKAMWILSDRMELGTGFFLLALWSYLPGGLEYFKYVREYIH